MELTSEGALDDYVSAVSVDDAGNTYVSGFTTSWDFLTTAYGNPLQPKVPYIKNQAHYVKLNPQVAAISSVELAGSDNVDAYASVPDGMGGLWIAGATNAQFPVTPNAYPPTYKGNYDGFLLHTDFALLCAGEDDEVVLRPITAEAASPERIHFAAQAGRIETVTSIRLAIDEMMKCPLTRCTPPGSRLGCRSLLAPTLPPCRLATPRVQTGITAHTTRTARAIRKAARSTSLPPPPVP